jgi:acyl-CoA dehydrogenase
MQDVSIKENANEVGRNDLMKWQESQPKNNYVSDPLFRALVSVWSREDGLDSCLVGFGAKVAQEIDSLTRENNLHINLPRLERFSRVGVRTEAVVHHPTYHQAGAMIYGAGIMTAYAKHANSFGALSRFYLSSYNGEAGHNCPIACTAGLIRVVQELADPELRERYLPGLLSPVYEEHLEGAQFLTEVQGGNDVGANATTAHRTEDGSWRIVGEKWFCSNVDADLFLMTARIDETTPGTRGLGLFLVPRKLDGGAVNAFSIRRLKDKLGTRSMASGECDFDGATAYHMGPVGQGFQSMMTLVINTSRLYNAVGSCGIARRAYVTAKTYADHRKAFGRPIIDYPLVHETLARTKSRLDLMTATTMHLVRLQDRIDAGEASHTETQFFRMALNLNKMWTAIQGRHTCVDAIEVLGGNGAIESFSVLPRLLRDMVVFENWEGSHNALLMQTVRDMRKYDVHRSFFAYLSKELSAFGDSVPSELLELFDSTKEALETANAIADPGLAALEVRDVSSALMRLTYLVCGKSVSAQLDKGGHSGPAEAFDESWTFFLSAFPEHRERRRESYPLLTSRIASRL